MYNLFSSFRPPAESGKGLEGYNSNLRTILPENRAMPPTLSPLFTFQALQKTFLEFKVQNL